MNKFWIGFREYESDLSITYPKKDFWFQKDHLLLTYPWIMNTEITIKESFDNEIQGIKDVGVAGIFILSRYN